MATTDQPKQQNFQIYLRVKPKLMPQNSTSPFHPEDYEDTIRKLSDTRIEMICPYYTDNDKNFQFDHVFDGQVNNLQLFERTMTVPINNVLNGFNSTVLIYGMTGAGKTYTMFGASNSIDQGRTTDGIIYLTLSKLFELVRRQPQSKTKVTLSFYEIYNETIRDLLRENSTSLNVMEDSVRGVFISDISEQCLETEHQARDFVKEGLERRAMNATKSNEVSSRSHAILQLTVRRFSQDSHSNKTKVSESKLFLIDLAGNQKSYSNSNKRFVEGVNINKSLLTLGKCINILAQQKKGQYVPFRDSKLTRILKESLGGNAKTVMIACVSSARKYYQETLNTLKYSCLAKNIKNKASKNIRDATKSDLSSVRNQCVVLKSERSLDQDPDSYIFQLLSDLFANIQRKTKSQFVLLNLKEARSRQTQQSSEIVLQLNDMVLSVEQERAQILQEGQRFYKTLIEHILSHKSSKQLPNNNTHDLQLQRTIRQQARQLESNKMQIQALKKQIQEKNSIITYLKDQSSLRQIKNQQDQQHNLSSNVLQPIISSEKQPLQSASSVRSSLFNSKNVQISKRSNSNQQNNNFSNSQIWNKMRIKLTSPESKRNKAGQADSTQLSIKNTSKILEEEDSDPFTKKTKSYLERRPKEIIIDLNDKITKEQFIAQMKDVERNMRDGKNSKDIQRIVNLQDENNFDLSSVQQSILRKLRFFQKQSTMRCSSNQKHKQSKDLKRSVSKKSIPVAVPVRQK